MKNLTDKVIAVTGAGSGIGRELAIQLAAKGAILALNDYNAASLAETVALLNIDKTKVSQHVFDVGKLKAVQDYIKNTIETHGQIDGIINNAGITLGRIKVNDMTYDEIDDLFQINIWGVIYGTKEALPHLIQRPESFIVNLSSVFGMMGVPTQSAYCMSKFAVRGLTESLRMELGRYPNITITQVHPGGIATNIIENSHTRTEDEKVQLKGVFQKSAKTTAKQAAATIINGIEKKKDRVLIGSDAKKIDIITRLFPTKYQRIFGRRKKKDKGKR